jgi:YegS/Rv2252/BmrU family lipid kinase
LNAGLVVNPAAGKRSVSSISRIKGLLKKETSLRIRITQKRGDAESFARELKGADLIIVAGGDGTVNEVVNGLLSDGATETPLQVPPLAVIPLGTANVLAQELSIPLNIEDAVRLALTGSGRKISLGMINGRYFILMVGIGFDGQTVYNLRKTLKRISGKGAYVVSGLMELAAYRPPSIRVKTDRGDITGTSAIIGNARGYGGTFHVTPEADITQPILDLCLFRGRGRMDIMKYAFGVVTKRHLKYGDVHYEKCSVLEVSSSERVHIQVDGDYFGTLPSKIHTADAGLSIIC